MRRRLLRGRRRRGRGRTRELRFDLECDARCSRRLQFGREVVEENRVRWTTRGAGPSRESLMTATIVVWDVFLLRIYHASSSHACQPANACAYNGGCSKSKLPMALNGTAPIDQCRSTTRLAVP